MNTQTEIFFNTVNLSGDDLKKASTKVGGQNCKVLEHFINNPYLDFTAAQLHLLFGQQMLLTSIRRALSTLVDKGFIEKTKKKRMGLYGMENFTYALKQTKSL